MTANPVSPATRLTVADYDEILAAGNEAAEYVNVFALKARAESERNLFAWGVLVSDEGRQLVVNLICRGYKRGTAMRIAIQAARGAEADDAEVQGT